MLVFSSKSPAKARFKGVAARSAYAKLGSVDEYHDKIAVEQRLDFTNPIHVDNR